MYIKYKIWSEDWLDEDTAEEYTLYHFGPYDIDDNHLSFSDKKKLVKILEELNDVLQQSCGGEFEKHANFCIISDDKSLFIKHIDLLRTIGFQDAEPDSVMMPFRTLKELTIKINSLRKNIPARIKSFKDFYN
jgi:hypothetical protein